MKKIFSITFVILLLILITLTITKSQEPPICEGNYILVELGFNRGNFEVLSKTIEQGCYSKISGSSSYSFALTEKGEILYESNFNPELIFIDSQPEGIEELTGGTIESKGIVLLAMKEIPEANNLEIYDYEKNKIFETTIYDAGATSCRID